jgi:hypothetical protein
MNQVAAQGNAVQSPRCQETLAPAPQGHGLAGRISRFRTSAPRTAAGNDGCRETDKGGRDPLHLDRRSAMFLFLLWDTGEIKQGLLRAVPNRLFEPALTRAIPTMPVFKVLVISIARHLKV